MSFARPEYRELAQAHLGELPALVASVDHVFSSPPLRLADSHRRLAGADNVLLLLHDLTIPESRRYRIDLQIDSGIVSTFDPRFHLYPAATPSFRATVRMPNFTDQIALVERGLSRVLPSVQARATYIRRFAELCDLVSRTLIAGEHANAFYCRFLPEFYTFLGFDALSVVATELRPTSAHALLRRFLPDLLDVTIDRLEGIGRLRREPGLFRTTLFVTADGKQSVEVFGAAARVRRGEAIPTHEVILWALACAGIRHFGRDFGFLARLAGATRDEAVKEFQATSPADDGTRWLQFIDARTYSFDTVRDRVMLIHPKPNRIENLCRAYLHLGSRLVDVWSEYARDERPVLISGFEVVA